MSTGLRGLRSELFSMPISLLSALYSGFLITGLEGHRFRPAVTVAFPFREAA
jgi:hypothetical protein